MKKRSINRRVQSGFTVLASTQGDVEPVRAPFMELVCILLSAVQRVMNMLWKTWKACMLGIAQCCCAVLRLELEDLLC